ncbi:crosslink repair DNA glycosylase YcaQ family protein [Fulvimarina sp. MAC8]|uniref:winged helix-turn-helix domain-containing protein n=1 Tax=Fulvimarina sp. MAC8 TaxID=3162874 RepID=UPI0032ECC7E4
MTIRVLNNRDARHIFMDRHLLAGHGASGADLKNLVTDLGFVQLDSIRTVERAHHMILRARHPGYKPKALKLLMERDRAIFEHWTHDASVIPMDFLPYWKMKFERTYPALLERFKQWRGPEFQAKLDETLNHIEAEGAVGVGDIGHEEERSGSGWWEWHPSKTALEFLWRTGRLAVSRRENFNKIYDLAARVYPDCRTASLEETIDWSCAAALDRLGFATSGELAAFWKLITPAEAKAWVARELEAGRLEHVDIEGADGRLRRHIARPNLAETIPEMPANATRVKILSPFDPMLRDRNRTERLFSFFYRIEVFVPEPKRQYGYYVFPVLQGDRIIGRLDAKADRARGALNVRAYWAEKGVRNSSTRIEALTTEIERLARFARCGETRYEEDWLRAS